jgi:hypothetical protein
MTPEEEAAWEADQKAQKEFDNAPERDRRLNASFHAARRIIIAQ